MPSISSSSARIASLMSRRYHKETSERLLDDLACRSALRVGEVLSTTSLRVGLIFLSSLIAPSMNSISRSARSATARHLRLTHQAEGFVPGLIQDSTTKEDAPARGGFLVSVGSQLPCQVNEMSTNVDVFDPCSCRKSSPNILVVQPAENWAAKNLPGSFDGTRERRILLQ
jgi:hypothetical protein